jgi:hydrogenase maturation factor HypF (carbamoyltransferase family)
MNWLADPRVCHKCDDDIETARDRRYHAGRATCRACFLGIKAAEEAARPIGARGREDDPTKGWEMGR